MFFAGPHSKVRLPDTTALSVASPLGGPFKRALDIFIALSALVLLSPLLILTTLLVLATAGRPVLHRDPRVGFGGRAIGCLKFRTSELGSGAQTSLVETLLVESRVVDFPQLINVLWGEMSCVGPQPLSADELSHQGGEVAAYLKARPGLTGTWRLGSRRREGEPIASPDLYLSSRSALGDIAILLNRISAPVRVEERD
jgi:exopolysaccharide production protein ExoY